MNHTCLSCASHCTSVILSASLHKTFYCVWKRFISFLSHILLYSVIKFKCFPRNSTLGDSWKSWDASLNNAKIYFTCVHGVKAVLTFIKTPSAGGFPTLPALSFHLASPSPLAFVSQLLIPADLFSHSPTSTKLSHLFPDFRVQPASLAGCCISLGPVADNRHYYSWFNFFLIYCQVLGA